MIDDKKPLCLSQLPSVKYIVTFFLSFFLLVSTRGQNRNLFSFDNLSGIYGVLGNPANLADNRYRLNVNITGTEVYAVNNYLTVLTPYSQLKALTGNIDTQYLDKNNVPEFSNSFITENLNGRNKFVNASFTQTLPSVMWNTKDRSGFAFSSQVRVAAQVSNLNEQILKIFLEDFDTLVQGYVPMQNQKRYIGKPGELKRFSAAANAWLEYNFSYARILLEDGAHVLKGGATIKILEGLGAAYVKVNNLDFTLIREDSINFSNADIEIGYVSDKYYDRIPPLKPKNLFGSGSPGWGLGFDFGLVYEYRPNIQKYVYQMDKNRWVDRTTNKYKYKIGASVTDMGTIRYSKDGYTNYTHLKSGSNAIGWSHFKRFQKLSTADKIDSFMLTLFPVSSQRDAFNAKLPMALHLSFERSLAANWYFSSKYVQSLRMKKTNGVRVQNIFTFGGRYERKQFGISFSLLIGRFYTPVHTALTIRVGPFYIGSDALGGILSTKNTNSASIYTGFSVPILYRKQQDKDQDMISDKFDLCPNTPGDIQADGCPDKDGDGVKDFDDNCPDLFGPIELKGCPDNDGDGVIGYKDKCPDVKGDPKHSGCPDSDGDTIYDHEDECLVEKGPAFLKGCPDRDNDSIADKHDQCPDLNGIVEFKGCPPPAVITAGDDRIDTCDFTKYRYMVVVGYFIARTEAEQFSVMLRRKTELNSSIDYRKDNGYYYIIAAYPLTVADAYQWLIKLDKPSYKKYLTQKAFLIRAK
jgi:hypothetical protein